MDNINFNALLEEELFWMDRNKEGLYESGYLLTKEQLLEETKNAIWYDDLEAWLESSDDSEARTVCGEYRSDNTFSVYRLRTYQDVKDALEWRNVDKWETCACEEFSNDYPDFVAPEYQINAVCYELTGCSLDVLPSGRSNPTFEKYVELLKPERLGIKYDELDYLKAEISVLVEEEKLTEEIYNSMVKEALGWNKYYIDDSRSLPL